MPAVLQPCDIGVIEGTRISSPCQPSSRPWIIAAASLGSGMAFLDSTVLNVALPALQADLGASVREVQWTYGAYAQVLWEIALGDGASSSLARRSSVWPRPGAPSPLVPHNSSLPEACRV
jgi:hypothetical protein